MSEHVGPCITLWLSLMLLMKYSWLSAYKAMVGWDFSIPSGLGWPKSCEWQVKWVQWCVGKCLTTGSLEQGGSHDLQGLPISAVQIIPPRMISSYQLDIAECEVGKERPQLALPTAAWFISAPNRGMAGVRPSGAFFCFVKVWDGSTTITLSS